MSKYNYMVFDECNGDYTFHETYEEAEKVYEAAKEFLLEDGSYGDEKVFIFKTKKMAYQVEDTDRKEAPELYGYDFWVKWEEKEENK